MSTKNVEIVLFFQRNLSPITSISQSRSVLHTFVLVRLKYNKTQPIKKKPKAWSDGHYIKISCCNLTFERLRSIYS